MEMPAPDDTVLHRRAEIVEALRQIVPGEGVIASEAERRAYESDGLTAYHQLPMVVVLPSHVDQVAAVLRYCRKNGVKVVPPDSDVPAPRGTTLTPFYRQYRNTAAT